MRHELRGSSHLGQADISTSSFLIDPLLLEGVQCVNDPMFYMEPYDSYCCARSEAAIETPILILAVKLLIRDVHDCMALNLHHCMIVRFATILLHSTITPGPAGPLPV